MKNEEMKIEKMEEDYLAQLQVPEGCELVHDADDVLLLDLDTPESVAHFGWAYELLKGRYGFQVSEMWSSRNGNTHVRVKLDKALSFEARMMLQAVLGSDLKRGALTLLYGVNVLFRPEKGKAA